MRVWRWRRLVTPFLADEPESLDNNQLTEKWMGRDPGYGLHLLSNAGAATTQVRQALVRGGHLLRPWYVTNKKAR